MLGIDIYRYGLYKHFEQVLIPPLFKILFEKAIRLCLENNQFIFQRYTKEKIEKSFISTGDGGFVIFDTPLHSLFFAINFEMVIRAYNSYHLYPKLRNIIGSLSLRYAISYDTIFHFDNNYYGSAIINCARILDKDTLNRCLIDQQTYDWFLISIDGLENLQVLTIEDIANIYDFLDYDRKFLTEGKNEILDSNASNRRTGIINSDILKVGQIQSKETLINIFNLHLQIYDADLFRPESGKQTDDNRQPGESEYFGNLICLFYFFFKNDLPPVNILPRCQHRPEFIHIIRGDNIVRIFIGTNDGHRLP